MTYDVMPRYASPWKEGLSVKRLAARAFLSMLAVAFMAGSGASGAKPPADRPLPGKVRLVLPRVIYGVVGIEMNVYFDNVVRVINPDNYAFKVICGDGWKGKQQAERWTLLPKTNDVGEVPFQLEVRDQDNAIVARAQSTIRILPAEAGAGREVTLLCVGDSLTHQGFYTQHLLDLCQGAGNPRLTLIGSHQEVGNSASNVHEGYGGRTTEWFANYYAPIARQGPWAQRGSPFLYLDPDKKPKLDFARYCQDLNRGKSPDIVTFFLGINDVFPLTDANLDSQIDDKIIKYYEMLIAMVHAVNKDTKIGVVLIPPPAASQDAFGENCSCVYNRWQYKCNQHRLVERLIEHFADREKDRIFLLPVYVNLDCRHNYPVNGVAWNARTTAGRAMQVNAVHPAPEGYRQIGDSFYCWIKAVLSLPTQKRQE